MPVLSGSKRGSWCLVVLALLAGRAAGVEAPADAVHKVGRGDVVQTVTERGVVETATAGDIICRVRSRGPNQAATTIKWLLEDGSPVKKGDKVAELDDSQLRDLLLQQELVVTEKAALLEQAELNQKLVAAQNQTELQKAEGIVELAALALKR